jgi:co-chaperonin GroES (HSP10)
VRIEPLANRVVMKEIEEGKRAGSLWIPDIARKNKGIAYAEVIAVGPGRNTTEGGVVPCHVKVGDTVMIPRTAPAVIPMVDDSGEEWDALMCPENDIIAVVHGLARPSSLVDVGGAPLSIVPQSLALPDRAYKNREDIAETLSDLRQQHAPPDVIADIESEQTDGDSHAAGD